MSWPATQAVTFQTFVELSFFLPVLASLSLGHLPRKAFLGWIAAAGIVISGLTVYAVARNGGLSVPLTLQAPFGQTLAGAITNELAWLLPGGLFIAQSLVLSSVAAERRWLPPYDRLFETSWNLAVHISLAAVFVGSFWLTLWLGSQLFDTIGLPDFARVIQTSWFRNIATCLAVALSIQVIDSRTRLVRGARSLTLTLFSLLLPLLAGISAAFLISLFFVPLDKLWNTHFTTSLLSGTAAGLILLVNATYQDGRPETRPSRLLRVGGRLAAIVILPVTVLAMMALSTRVAQYGWSMRRILAAAFLFQSTLYATGILSLRCAPNPGLDGLSASTWAVPTWRSP